MNNWQNTRHDNTGNSEPVAVLDARDLDKRLRGAFADPRKDRDKSEPNFKLSGLPLVVSLKKISDLLKNPAVASQEILLANYGENPSAGNLELLGQELGLKLSINRVRAKKILKAPTPFVALLSDNTSIAILGKNATGQWICETANGRCAINSKQLLTLSNEVYVGVLPLDVKIENNEGRADKNSIHAGSGPLLGRFSKLVFENKRAKMLQLWFAAALSNLILIALPLFITIVYDRVIPHGAFETLAALSIGIILIFAIDIGLRTTRINLQEAVGVGTGLKLQTLYYRKLLCAPLAKSQKSSSGVSVLLGEIEQVALSMPALFAGLMADLPFVLIMLTLVGFLTGPVVLVPIVGILIIVIVNTIGSFRARRAAGEAHGLRLKLQDETVATGMMLPTIKAVGAEQKLLGRWEKSADETAFKMHRARQAAVISGQISLVVTQLVIAMTIVAGAIQINSGAMTLGNLAASVLLVGRILAPVSQVVSQLGQLGNMGAALKTFFSVIDQEDEKGGDEPGAAGLNFKGRIKLHNVSFTYEGAAAKSLDGVSFEIQAGERVGIIGRNGCGKSTLLKIIPRFFDPDEGSFLLDGYDARQVSPQFLRRSIGLMSQETVLMQDSLRSNICMGLDRVDPEAFEQATKISGVADLARAHPKGYSLDVGPRGEALSGGERQQVGLARAILRNPSMLILDEPTSAMDNSSEGRLISALPPFLAGRTLILATHRTQMLALVDRVIFMDRGRIVSDGPKEQVLANLQKTG